jgi:polar amino acid transport system substrate-binding protein
MKRIIQYGAVFCAVLIFWGTAATGETFKIMTEEYPPFNFMEEGKLTGLSTEVVQQLAKKIGHPEKIEMLPWARAYGLIQQSDGQILFSMTRTEEREKMFKWVGPIASNKWVFFAKKGSGITLGSLEDAKKVEKIGTYKDDAAESFIKAEGFTNIDSVVNDDQNVPKLMAGRINLWIVGELQGIHKAKAKGVADQLEKVLDVKDTQLYIAFSKNTSDAEVAKWQAALDAMKADGSYDALIMKYM